ncbi:MAG: hypothetical protein QG635_21 [Bacteroidota bacterium]|nr:hypothetical protein [Bacteroidota bacterium]
MKITIKHIIPLLIIYMISTLAMYSNQVVINEFYPAPTGDEPEWIELYNPSDYQVLLSGIFVCDAASCKKIIDVSIQAHSYILITSDSATLADTRKIPSVALVIESKLPTLNNTTDKIILRNSDSSVIDSLYYDIKWGIKGKSFERRDWSFPASRDNLIPSISYDGATAGYLNSVSIPIELTEGLKAEPNPFTPNKNGQPDNCKISYSIPFDNSRLEAAIYNTSGEKIRNLFSGNIFTNKGFLLWDGKNDKGYELEIGPYILLFEASDINSDRNYSSKLMIVIGR